jgi:hypothetical protein
MLRQVLFASTVAVVAVASGAGASSGRQATASYNGASYVPTGPYVTVAGQKVGPVGGFMPRVIVAGTSTGGATFAVKPGERTVTVTLTDRTGQSVGGVVSQSKAGNRVVLASFCGHSRPVGLVGADAVTISPAAITTCAGLPTTGSIAAEFTR